MRTEFWAAVVKPGQPHKEQLRYPLHLTQATMSFRGKSHLEPQEVHISTALVTWPGQRITPAVLLCTLGTLPTGETVQHIPRLPLDFKIQSGCEVTLTATAPIHLIGYLEIDEG